MIRSQEIEMDRERAGDDFLDGLTLARETWNLRDAALQKLAMDLQNGEHRLCGYAVAYSLLESLTSNVSRILKGDDFDKTQQS